jgi:AraC-like DNA-binding protein
MDRIRVSHTAVARLTALGISPTDILRQAHLPPTLFQQERVFVTTAQWFALWAALETWIDDPAFGFKIAHQLEGTPYDPLTITALSAPSFYAGLHKVARYKRLFSSEDMRLTRQGHLWTVELVWLATEQPAPSLLIDLAFAHVVELGQRGTGQMLYPERITFQRNALHRAMYEAYFHCPIDFGAERDVLLFNDEAMMQPFSTANPDLLALLEPQLETERREQFTHQSSIDQIECLIRTRIAGQPPTVQEVARELHMSPRTLQRRLADEGVHFQHLLRTVRHELAKEYLRSSLELNEIAFLLGYQEANSFHRAFHDWEGLSPGHWRMLQH